MISIYFSDKYDIVNIPQYTYNCKWIAEPFTPEKKKSQIFHDLVEQSYLRLMIYAEMCNQDHFDVISQYYSPKSKCK